MALQPKIVNVGALFAYLKY